MEMNTIEVFSIKQKKIIFEYLDVPDITNEMIDLAKVESVLGYRPAFLTTEVLEETLKIFDEYYILLINGEKEG